MSDKAIRVREDVHRQVRAAADDAGVTMGELIGHAIRHWRHARANPQKVAFKAVEVAAGKLPGRKLVPFTRGRQA